MSQIFLSYGREDVEFMRRLRADLRAAGFIVWTDESGLEPGTPAWEAELEQAIEGSVALVVLLTPASKESIWVTRELSYADTHGLKIFPVLVEGDSRSAVPLRLTSTQRIDARQDYEGALAKLTTSLNKIAGPQAATRPAPEDAPPVRLKKSSSRRPLFLVLFAVIAGVCGCLLFVGISIPSLLPADPGSETPPDSFPEEGAAPPQEEEAPPEQEEAPRAPLIFNEYELTLYDEATKVFTILIGGEEPLPVMDLWSAPFGTPVSCASGILAFTWMVRQPYPEGGEFLELRRLIPQGDGRTEIIDEGQSGQASIGYCNELFLINNGLEDYIVEIRYASGSFEAP